MARWSPSPTVWVRVHGALVIIWAALTVPAVLVWRDSVEFIVLASVYANIAGSIASWQSARADRNSPTCEDLQRIERKVDRLVRRAA